MYICMINEIQLIFYIEWLSSMKKFFIWKQDFDSTQIQVESESVSCSVVSNFLWPCRP